jgi:hypothetical protein
MDPNYKITAITSIHGKDKNDGKLQEQINLVCT